MTRHAGQSSKDWINETLEICFAEQDQIREELKHNEYAMQLHCEELDAEYHRKTLQRLIENKEGSPTICELIDSRQIDVMRFAGIIDYALKWPPRKQDGPDRDPELDNRIRSTAGKLAKLLEDTDYDSILSLRKLEEGGDFLDSLLSVPLLSEVLREIEYSHSESEFELYKYLPDGIDNNPVVLDRPGHESAAIHYFVKTLVKMLKADTGDRCINLVTMATLAFFPKSSFDEHAIRRLTKESP